MLEILDDIVYVESDDGTHFLKQIKDVTLNLYQEGNCSTVLKILQDSQVETLTVRTEYGMEGLKRFWLDDVGKINMLKELTLENIMIRVRGEAALDGRSLERITGHIDMDTKEAEKEAYGSRTYISKYLKSIMRRTVIGETVINCPPASYFIRYLE